MASVPSSTRWLFWDVDHDGLELLRDRNFILPRVLEFGRLEDVRWLITAYGMEGIHDFLRTVGHPELSRRTLGFWRAALKAEGETWASPPEWRKSNAAPWID